MCYPDPAQVDLLNEREVVQYLRDLLNLHDLIEGGIEERMKKLKSQLQRLGWSKDRIHNMEMRASHNTRYERLIPPPIAR
jgi:hypothetical protein